MVETCVDALIESLSLLQNQLWLPYGERQRLGDFGIDLRFIKLFLFCSVSWDSDADIRSIFASIESKWEGIWDHDRVCKELTSLPSSREIKKAFDQLGKKIIFSKEQINKFCEHMISRSLTCKALKSDEILQILDAIIKNMDYLVSRVGDEVLPGRIGIDSVKEKLLIFRDLVEITGVGCINGTAVEDFNIHVLTWASKAACLVFLYWEAVQNGVRDENYWCGLLTCGLVGRNRINLLLTDLLIKVNPCTPEFIDMCFAAIKFTQLSYPHIILFEGLVSSFVDFLLHNLMFTSKENFWILREGLIITFLAHAPVNYVEDSELIFLRTEIDAVLIETSYVLCLFGGAKVTFTSEKTVLAKLVKMIGQIKGKNDKYHLQLPHSSSVDFPMTNGLGFVESLLVYLSDLEQAMSSHPKLVSSLKPQILTVKDELVSLRPFLQHILELLNEYKELKDLWEEIITVAHQAELTIKQPFFTDRSLRLSCVLHNIQAIQSKVRIVKESQTYTAGVVSSSTSSNNVLTVSVPTSGLDEEVIGFKENLEELIDRLTVGNRELDIVSIVGMGGIGKTTLAKKLYNEAAVRHCFQKRAFCTITQVYRSKELLLDISSQLIGNNVNASGMAEEDIGLRLYKSLKGCKYLIVLDDIWDVNAWNSVKNSFPDDHNGSRIMFTSRVYDVALKAKPNCSVHLLRFLTVEESWKLLQQKIFHKDPCPLYLCEVGRLIAKNCKGLPLAIVLVAGLLAKSKRSLSWWQKVANNLKSYVYSEGYTDILELSYKHLPKALKSCFLYLGAFPEDNSIRADTLCKLWIAEGFVQKLDGISMHNAAKGYLNDLVERNLIIETKRSVAGATKRVRLHDVTRDFCIRKVQETRLVRFVDGKTTIHKLRSSFFRSCRLVQVLDLRHLELQDFPTEVTMLVHLIHLTLKCNCSHVLPTIANLRNLKSFLIQGSGVVHLPDAIWKMKKLRYLKFPRGCCFEGLDDVASKVFPQLSGLETLGCVWIKDKKRGEELLRRLPKVQKLSCHYYGSDFGCEISLGLTSALRKLSLRRFRLPPKKLSAMIGNVPCLQVLKLSNCTFDGDRWDVENDEFPNLKCLTIRYSGMKYWNATADSFPCLEILVLHGCHKLVEIPPGFGDVPTLSVLEVKYCSVGVKTSAIRIHEEQLDFGNDITLNL